MGIFIQLECERFDYWDSIRGDKGLAVVFTTFDG